MLLGVVLLYVGVVLIVNGIWLVGTAYAAAARRAPAMDMETVAAGGSARRGLAEEAAAGQELAGERVVASPRRNAEAAPWFIQNREVAVLNIFTGFVGVAVATTYIVLGATRTVPAAGLAEVRAGELPALVVCHRGVMRLALTHARGGGLSAIDVPNASLVELGA